MSSIIIRALMTVAVALACGAGFGLYVGIDMRSVRHGVRYGAVIFIVGLVVFGAVIFGDYVSEVKAQTARGCQQYAGTLARENEPLYRVWEEKQ